MNIWLLKQMPDDFEILELENQSDAPKFLQHFKGKSMVEFWQPVKVKTVQTGSQGDYPGGLILNPVFSQNALDKLLPIVKQKIEILELLHKKEKYFAINVTNVLDCIDPLNSVAETLISGAISGYKQFSFHETMIKDEHIFKIYIHDTQRVLSKRIFVSDLFRDTVINNGLKGFGFEKVWSINDQAEYEKIPHHFFLEQVDMCFDEALNRLKEMPEAIASGKWKIQYDSKNQLLLGQWDNNNYNWSQPFYFPPILLDLRWKVVTKSQIYY